MAGSGVVTCRRSDSRPILLHLPECRLRSPGMCGSANESMNLVQIIRLTECKDHFSRLTELVSFLSLSRRRINAGARVTGESDASQSGRVETEPCPRELARSAVTDWLGEREAAKAIFFAKSPTTHFRANIVPLPDRTTDDLEWSVFMDGSKTDSA